MHFCPICGNLLLIEEGNVGMRFCCPTCPYRHDIKDKYSSNAKIKKKQVDDVLGGSDAWENVDRTSAKCPYCSNDTAFFMQIQIRSADEPSTNFYRCCRCAKQWNDWCTQEVFCTVNCKPKSFQRCGHPPLLLSFKSVASRTRFDVLWSKISTWIQFGALMKRALIPARFLPIWTLLCAVNQN